MANYQAFLQDTKWPLGYFKELRAGRIDVINRAILATGKTWPGLELPRAIKAGHYFRAAFDGMTLTIHKDS